MFDDRWEGHLQMGVCHQLPIVHLARISGDGWMFHVRKSRVLTLQESHVAMESQSIFFFLD